MGWWRGSHLHKDAWALGGGEGHVVHEAGDVPGAEHDKRRAMNYTSHSMSHAGI